MSVDHLYGTHVEAHSPERYRYATAYVSRSSSDLEVQQWFDRRDRSLDGPPKGQITAVTSQIAASSLTQHGLPLGIRRLAEKLERELG